MRRASSTASATTGAIATTTRRMPAPTSRRGACWIGGEELHNNHHTYPTSAKFSLKWFEFDLGWTYIRAHAGAGSGQGAARRAGARRCRRPSRRRRPRDAAGGHHQPLRPARQVRAQPDERLSRGTRKPCSCTEAERARFARLKRWLRKGDVSALPAEEQRSLTRSDGAQRRDEDAGRDAHRTGVDLGEELGVARADAGAVAGLDRARRGESASVRSRKRRCASAVTGSAAA